MLKRGAGQEKNVFNNTDTTVKFSCNAQLRKGVQERDHKIFRSTDYTLLPENLLSNIIESEMENVR
jgi:hypothetical protein